MVIAPLIKKIIELYIYIYLLRDTQLKLLLEDLNMFLILVIYSFFYIWSLINFFFESSL